MSSVDDPMQRVLATLSDGGEYSTSQLAQQAGIPSEELPNLLESMQDLGVGLVSSNAKLQWEHANRLLSAQAIRQRLAAPLLQNLAGLRVDRSCGSTNDRVAELDLEFQNQWALSATEFQNQGRGRRGRTWSSPFGAGLCFSLALRLAPVQPPSGALALVAGVAVAQTVRERLGIDALIKWPNDLVVCCSNVGAKLGGILTESTILPGGDLRLVIGIGLNVNSAPTFGAGLVENALPAACLSDLYNGVIDRNELLASLCEAVMSEIEHYQRQGFTVAAEKFSQLDYLAHRPVQVLREDYVALGVARGVDSSGALQVESDGQIETVLSGEVSVRTV